MILAEIEAYKQQDIKVINANNILHLSKLRAEAKAVHTVMEAEAYKNKAHALADNAATIIRKNAETRLGVAKDKSEALIIDATAELENADKLHPER